MAQAPRRRRPASCPARRRGCSRRRQATGQSLAYGELGDYRFDDPEPLARDFAPPPFARERDGLARFIRNCPCNSSTILVIGERYWAAGGCDERLVSPDQALFLRLFAAGGGAHVAGTGRAGSRPGAAAAVRTARRSRYESVLALYYLVTETPSLDRRYIALAYRRALSRARRFHRAHGGALWSRHLLRYIASLVSVPQSPAAAIYDSLSAFTEDGSTSGRRLDAGRAARSRSGRAARGPAAGARDLSQGMCGLAGFFDPDHRIDPARWTPSPSPWRTASPIAGRTVAARGAMRRPASRSDFAASPSSICRRRAISRCTRPTAASSWCSTARSTITRRCAARSTRNGKSRWRGHSDSEVLVEAIARWGMRDAIARANGMFAVAVWDRRERRLFLARDRLGEKPLAYGWIGGVFLFASELSALAPHPAWTGAIDRGALGLFLDHGYIPAPWTAYEGMRKLPPGSILECTAERRDTAPAAYWSAAGGRWQPPRRLSRGTPAAAVEQLEALIDDAVAMRMEADVPLGAFLSGGIDSSAVVAAMARSRPGAVRSFCVGFPDRGFDESPHAEAVARHLGTQHETLLVSEPQCLDAVTRLGHVYDEPFADASRIPTLILCRLTRAHVTVSLSGDGGDELFGGYARYAGAARMAPARAPPAALRARGRRGGPVAGANGARAAAAAHAEGAAHRTPETLYRDYLTPSGRATGSRRPRAPYPRPPREGCPRSSSASCCATP